MSTVVKTCECGAEFNTTNDSNMCYDCTLASVTGGASPEEGDFNTAKIISGTITRQERGWLQEDLEGVEVQEDPLQTEAEHEEEEFWNDYYPEYCSTCGAPANSCSC